jgi:FkbM family methyltransferase
LRRQRARREFYRQFVARGSLVFDVGANVGHYALVFLSLGARVVAVEPQGALVATLRRRFARNGNITVIHTALGSKAGSATLQKAPGLSEIASLRADIAQRSRFASEHAFTETETVPLTTLDSLLDAYGTPGFCKIDVEGFEREVLAGLTRPLPLVSLEFNREFWSETEACIERLESQGPYRFNYALGDTAMLASSQWLSASETLAAISSHRDPLLWGDVYARVM